MNNHLRRYSVLYVVVGVIVIALILLAPLKQERAADGTVLNRRSLLYSLRHRASTKNLNANVPPAQNTNSNSPVNTNTASNTNAGSNTNSKANTNTATNTNVPPTTSGSVYGVMVSAGVGQGNATAASDLGARWVRANYDLDGKNPDKFNKFLDAGINVVMTVSNKDPNNILTTYGTQAEWPNAGFPYKDKATYQNDIRGFLTPYIPYLASGRQIMVQCENEITDATTNLKARFWRGTLDQYMQLLSACYDAVHGMDSRFKVVLSSFPSESMDLLIHPTQQPRSQTALTRTTTMLGGKYDVVDPHFYGCVEDIPTKVQWIKSHMKPGSLWITTESSGPDSRCASTPTTYEQDPAKFNQVQVQQVQQRMDACAQNGGSVCLWFSLFDLKDETSVFNHMGLIDSRTSPVTKKPAYGALKTYIASHQ